MATDYDAIIADWETNGPAKVQERINQLQYHLDSTANMSMKRNIQRSIDYLTEASEQYISETIQNWQRAKIENVNKAIPDEPEV